MKGISDSCVVGDHLDCDGTVYRESKGMLEAVGQCSCGCHYPERSMREEPLEDTIRKARKEEMRLFDKQAEKLRAIASMEGST